MLLNTAVYTNHEPVYFAILLAAVGLALLVVRLVRRKKPEAPAPVPDEPAPTKPAPPAAPAAPAGAPGYVLLDGVSEEDAAVLMAITADRLGLPPERLCFRSIHRVGPEIVGATDQEAAVLMAITAYRTGRTPETLDFKSIKLVEE